MASPLYGDSDGKNPSLKNCNNSIAQVTVHRQEFSELKIPCDAGCRNDFQTYSGTIKKTCKKRIALENDKVYTVYVNY